MFRLPSCLRCIPRQKAVAAKIDGADNSKFLEQFRYVIITSQLLSGHSIVPHHQGRVPEQTEIKPAAEA